MHRIVTGDFVFCKTTREKGIVALVQGKKFCWLQYELQWVNISNCRILKPADDKERLRALRLMASYEDSDPRAIYAKLELQKLED